MNDLFLVITKHCSTSGLVSLCKSISKFVLKNQFDIHVIQSSQYLEYIDTPLISYSKLPMLELTTSPTFPPYKLDYSKGLRSYLLTGE